MSSKPFVPRAWELDAILTGRQTMFVRPLKFNHPAHVPPEDLCRMHSPRMLEPGVVQFRLTRPDGPSVPIRCPYGKPGEFLWLKETWQCWEWASKRERGPVCYKSTHEGRCCKFVGHLWLPAITMPRWASRYTLRVLDVQAKQVCEITDDEAVMCGVEREDGHWKCYAPKCGCYGKLAPGAGLRSQWNAMYPEYPAIGICNPWAWAVKFEVVRVEE